jgi:uncharacterized protein (DUF58 family)
MAHGTLLDTAFLQRLEGLALSARKRFTGDSRGERRSPRKGANIEFADFREYAPGDDLRYVDWKAFGRLDKLFLKLFQEEEDLSVHFLIDASRSMGFGAPTTKFDYARRVAAAIGFIGLMEQDRVDVFTFASGRQHRLPPLRGKAGIPEFFRFLETLPSPAGQTGFGDSVRRYAEQTRTPGISILLSDFFDPSVQDGIRALLARRHQVVMLHILDSEEASPTLTGDLKLIDSETDDVAEISLSPHVLAQYETRFRGFCTGLETLAARYGIDYARVTTDVPHEEIVFKYLRRSGLIK